MGGSWETPLFGTAATMFTPATGCPRSSETSTRMSIGWLLPDGFQTSKCVITSLCAVATGVGVELIAVVGVGVLVGRTGGNVGSGINGVFVGVGQIGGVELAPTVGVARGS